MLFDVQKILDKIILSDSYKAGPSDTMMHSDSMRNAAHAAYNKGYISLHEREIVLYSVDRYLRTSSSDTLQDALAFAGHDHTFEARLAIYKDWENRPSLKPTLFRHFINLLVGNRP